MWFSRWWATNALKINDPLDLECPKLEAWLAWLKENGIDPDGTTSRLPVSQRKDFMAAFVLIYG